MNVPGARRLARRGELYPAVILHGGSGETRLETAVELARVLLCAAPSEARPCGECPHCRRIAWPPPEKETFHPDFQVLERDLVTSTSVGATKTLLKAAQLSPFEARGQVFIFAHAETLTGEAANALLKILEEPPASAPRHFFLLTPSAADMLPTLRSRSLEIYLGGGERPAEEEIRSVADSFVRCLEAYGENGAPVWLMAAARALHDLGGWDDPRAGRPWSRAQAAVLEAWRRDAVAPPLRAGLLALAEELLDGPRMRVRRVSPQRILEGMVSANLAAARPSPSGSGTFASGRNEG